MKKIKLGFMQGRLSPKIRDQIQAFPFDSWENEFKIAKDINFKIMEWTIDSYRYKHNPVMSEKGKKRIKILQKKTRVNITVTCKKKRLYGDFNEFKSDKTPTKKIKNII